MAKHHSILSGVLGALTIMFLASLAVPASAAPNYCTDMNGLPCLATGVNDDEAEVETALYDALGYSVNVMQIDKAEQDNGWSGPNGLTVSFNPYSGGTSGTWTYTGPETIAYVTIKAGNNFVLYDATQLIDNTAANYVAGHWSSMWLTNFKCTQQALSHLSIWKVASTNVPEPMSLSLIILALAMVIWQYARRTANARELKAVAA